MPLSMAAPAPNGGYASSPARTASPASGGAPRTAGRAWLGPVVLIIGGVGVLAAWALPFDLGRGSLLERAFGPGGYGVAFWQGYPSDAGLLAAAYFGVAGPAPAVAAGLIALAGWGFARGSPGRAQRIGLAVAGVWAAAVIVLFGAVEVVGPLGDGLLALLRGMTPGGVVLLLAALVSGIGVGTRLAGG